MIPTKSSKLIILMVALFQTSPYFALMMFTISFFTLSVNQCLVLSSIVTLFKLVDNISELLMNEKIDELNYKLDKLIESKN